jgi:hypothetical protein
MATRNLFLLAVAAALCSGCATIPYGPSIPVMPAKGKTLATFESDVITCRRFAERQTGISPTDAGASAAAKSAVVGTALGAAAGAAFDGGEGAAVGAGAGLLAGSLAGAGMAGASANEIQYRYDNAYAQCMKAQGNRVAPPDRDVAAAAPPPYYPAVREEYVVEEYVYEEPVYVREYCPDPHYHHHRHHHGGYWY